jgi:hypothetical protein
MDGLLLGRKFAERHSDFSTEELLVLLWFLDLMAPRMLLCSKHNSWPLSSKFKQLVLLLEACPHLRAQMRKCWTG